MIPLEQQSHCLSSVSVVLYLFLKLCFYFSEFKHYAFRGLKIPTPGVEIMYKACCCSVTWSCLTLCDLMDCSTLSFRVLYYLLGFAQTHVLRVGDAIQSSHSLSSPWPPDFNLVQSYPRVIKNWHNELFHKCTSLLIACMVWETETKIGQL